MNNPGQPLAVKRRIHRRLRLRHAKWLLKQPVANEPWFQICRRVRRMGRRALAQFVSILEPYLEGVLRVLGPWVLLLWSGILRWIKSLDMTQELNPVDHYPGKPAMDQNARRFQKIIEAAGIPCTIRLRRGIDIQAGCGQLASNAI